MDKPGVSGIGKRVVVMTERTLTQNLKRIVHIRQVQPIPVQEDPHTGYKKHVFQIEEGILLIDIETLSLLKRGYMWTYMFVMRYVLASVMVFIPGPIQWTGIGLIIFWLWRSKFGKPVEKDAYDGYDYGILSILRSSLINIIAQYVGARWFNNMLRKYAPVDVAGYHIVTPPSPVQPKQEVQ